MTPTKYQPDSRLIDRPEELRHLYLDEDLTVREIADNHAEVEKTRVWKALDEHGLRCSTDDQMSESTTEEEISIDWRQHLS